MGAVHVPIASWYPKLKGSHFGLPPSSVHRMTGLGGRVNGPIRPVRIPKVTFTKTKKESS